ncbi:hypothetical protein Y88_3118 [Novosphingobium nitrogenifigens DSM 19370]|uniref:Uncharacterized protein n=1 Tax=Novosphingobium nitrogenifigens DSM 19370 TaxID=983920 RepID=F1ZC71_9SPHN|nr:hypothetical protein Y88_3118 [Novosphingobium nitrogenifigens DSM 19370]
MFSGVGLVLKQGIKQQRGVVRIAMLKLRHPEHPARRQGKRLDLRSHVIS